MLITSRKTEAKGDAVSDERPQRLRRADVYPQLNAGQKSRKESLDANQDPLSVVPAWRLSGTKALAVRSARRTAAKAGPLATRLGMKALVPERGARRRNQSEESVSRERVVSVPRFRLHAL